MAIRASASTNFPAIAAQSSARKFVKDVAANDYKKYYMQLNYKY